MAFQNDPPVRQIITPADATTGDSRIVTGADTPAELVTYGVTVALLFYVKDFPTNLEVGYFFIGLSNILDDGNDNILLFGQVVYPTPGNPASATSANVKTHFQMGLNDVGTGNNSSSRFKDFNVVISDNIPYFQNSSQTTLMKSNTEYVGWPIGARKIKRKAITQDYTNMASTSNFDADLFFDDLVPGTYHAEAILYLIGGAAQDIRTNYDVTNITGTKATQGPTFSSASYTSRSNTAVRTDWFAALTNEIGYSMSDSVNATLVREVLDFEVSGGTGAIYMKHRQSAVDPANTGLLLGSKMFCERYI